MHLDMFSRTEAPTKSSLSSSSRFCHATVRARKRKPRRKTRPARTTKIWIRDDQDILDDTRYPRMHIPFSAQDTSFPCKSMSMSSSHRQSSTCVRSAMFPSFIGQIYMCYFPSRSGRACCLGGWKTYAGSSLVLNWIRHATRSPRRGLGEAVAVAMHESVVQQCVGL